MTVQTTYALARDILNHFFAGVPVTAPTALYIGLFPADPGPNGASATELSGLGAAGYARAAISFSAPAAAPADPGTITNNAVTFPVAGSSWGLVAWWGIFDAPTAGNLLARDSFVTSQTVSSGSTIRIPAGNLTIALP